MPAAWLREVFGGRLLYTLGGDAEGPDRGERLIAAAAQGYDLVELDAERDIRGDLLARIPPEQRLICWRGTAVDASELASRFRRLSRIEARSYLLIVHARRASDGLAPLLFLRSAGRRDVTAYADGELGLWSRILAPRLGAALVFAGGRDSGPEIVEWPDPGAADRRIRPALAADGRSNLRDRGGGGEPVALPRPAQRRVSGAWAIRDCSSLFGSTRSRSSGARSSRAGRSSRSACESRASRSLRRTRRRRPR